MGVELEVEEMEVEMEVEQCGREMGVQLLYSVKKIGFVFFALFQLVFKNQTIFSFTSIYVDFFTFFFFVKFISYLYFLILYTGPGLL